MAVSLKQYLRAQSTTGASGYGAANIPPDVAALPNMQGSGAAHNFHVQWLIEAA
jgi:hypothetical protein